MTAPLRPVHPVTLDPTPVRMARSDAGCPVALGDRAYDIVIGRGLARIARGARRRAQAGRQGRDRHRRRGRRRFTSAPPRRRSPRPGSRRSRVIVGAGEGAKSFAGFERVCEALIAATDRARRPRGGARRRRGRRSRRLCRRRGAARPRLHPGADDAARPGRFLRRRQDRDQFEPRQEPRRRVPPADPRRRRHRPARHAAGAPVPGRLCGGRQIRPARRCRVLRLARRQSRSRCFPAARRANTPSPPAAA